ncbi:MAG TPA: hypothetical protein VFK02_23915 [Kofleriaceae bacterium]|nr:hypothetical protein [Kofleriaceae bacterium]
MDRRLELEGWIARTRRTRRQLVVGVVGAGVIAVALAAWSVRIGLVGLGGVAIVAVCGLWITASHLADWRGKLERLDRLERMDQARREAMRSGPHARPPAG